MRHACHRPGRALITVLAFVLTFAMSPQLLARSGSQKEQAGVQRTVHRALRHLRKKRLKTALKMLEHSVDRMPGHNDPLAWLISKSRGAQN